MRVYVRLTQKRCPIHTNRTPFSTYSLYFSFFLLSEPSVNERLHILLRHLNGELCAHHEDDELHYPWQCDETQLQSCVHALRDEEREHRSDKAHSPHGACRDEGHEISPAEVVGHLRIHGAEHTHVLGAEEGPREAYVNVGDEPTQGVAPRRARYAYAELAAEELVHGQADAVERTPDDEHP